MSPNNNRFFLVLVIAFLLAWAIAVGHDPEVTNQENGGLLFGALAGWLLNLSEYYIPLLVAPLFFCCILYVNVELST
jgi:hypothetical protein